jgi:hypothetical protein
VRLLKLYYTPCPAAAEILQHAFHVGFRVKGGSVSHVFRLRGSGRPRLRIEGASVSVSSRCVFLETRKCLLKDLLERFHVVSFKVHRDYVVVILAVGGRNCRLPRAEEYGPCLLRVEEVKPCDIEFTPEDLRVVEALEDAGYLKYRRSSRLGDIARRLGVPKSRLAYIVRRVAKKALVHVA